MPMVTMTWFVNIAASIAIDAAHQVSAGCPIKEAATRLTIISPGSSSNIHENWEDLILSPANKPRNLIIKAAMESVRIKIQYSFGILIAFFNNQEIGSN